VTVAQAIPSCIHHGMTLLRLLIVPGLLLLQVLLLEVLVILSGNASSTDTLLMAFYKKIRGNKHTHGSTCLRSGCCLALSLSHVLMCAVIRYLWIPCLLLLTISSLNIVGLCLGLLQKCTHMITVLNCRLFLLSRDGSVRRRVIQHWCVVSKDIRWFLWTYSCITVILLLLHIWVCRGSAFPLSMLNDRLLLFIWLLLILICGRVIRVEALVLHLRWLLPRFVCPAYTILSV
jgi:hypothetical protein